MVFMWSLASFQFARRMIPGLLEYQFHSCAHASNLSSVCPNSTTRKGPDNRHGEDATLMLTFAGEICCANWKLPTIWSTAVTVEVGLKINSHINVTQPTLK